MFSHIMVGSNDIARSKKFYDAVFVAMGAQPGVEDAGAGWPMRRMAGISWCPNPSMASRLAMPMAAQSASR